MCRYTFLRFIVPMLCSTPLSAGKSPRITKAIYRAGRGNLQDQGFLGWYYLQKKEYQKGIRWLTKAAEHEDAAAQHNMGVCYQYGDGVPADPKIATLWYARYVQKTDKDARCAICFDPLIGEQSQEQRDLASGCPLHLFHAGCINAWKKRCHDAGQAATCPPCTKEICEAKAPTQEPCATPPAPFRLAPRHTFIFHNLYRRLFG